MKNYKDFIESEIKQINKPLTTTKNQTDQWKKVQFPFPGVNSKWSIKEQYYKTKCTTKIKTLLSKELSNVLAKKI